MSASPETLIANKIIKTFNDTHGYNLTVKPQISIPNILVGIFRKGILWFREYCNNTKKVNSRIKIAAEEAYRRSCASSNLDPPDGLVFQIEQYKGLIENSKNDLKKEWDKLPEKIAIWLYCLSKESPPPVQYSSGGPEPIAIDSISKRLPIQIRTPKRVHPKNVPIIKERPKKDLSVIQHTVTVHNIVKFPEVLAYLMRMRGSWQGSIADAFKALREYIVQDENPDVNQIDSFVQLGAFLNLIQRDTPPAVKRSPGETLVSFAERVLSYDVYKTTNPQEPTKEFYDTMQSLIDLHHHTRLNRVLIDRYIMV